MKRGGFFARWRLPASVWRRVPLGRRLLQLAGEERGAAATEYALLLGVMGVGTIAAWQHLGESVRAIVTAATAALDGLIK